MYLKRWLLAVALLIWPLQALGVSTSVVISELQTGSQASATQEFVELYNASAVSIDLTGWRVQYKSATSASENGSWSTKANLAGQIPGHGFFLVAPQTYLSSADAAMSSGLAASGGHIRLLDAAGGTIDIIGWGTANAPEQQAATAPQAGQSLERLAGERSPGGGNGYDSDNNSTDFGLRPLPEPQNSYAAVEVLEPYSDWSPTQQPETQTPAPELQIEITELMVDPASPLSDATDEFIEFYNAGEVAVNLGGYLLKTGSQFRDSHTIGELVIAPGAYAVLYSRQTHLSLTNSGGSARLLSPDGAVVAQAPEYEDAPEGESWSGFEDGWQWSLAATPGTDNVLETAPKEVAAAKMAKAKAAKAAKTKAAKAKTSRVAAAKSQGPEKAPANGEETGLRTTDPASQGLLIGALGLTIAYAIYEYRHDIRNYLIRAKRKLKAGREARPPA